jgi:hypothetical protein
VIKEVDMARTARAIVLQKQAQALVLIKAGDNYDEIAAALGYANRGSAWRLTQNALKATVDRLAEDHVGTEIERLDALQVGYWAAATTGGDKAAAHLVLKIVDARVRLLGLHKRAEPEAEPRTVVMSAARAAEWNAANGPATP